MGKCSSVIDEIRFYIQDEQITHVYVISRAIGDCPVQMGGCYHKAFPARIPLVDILQEEVPDHLLWDHGVLPELEREDHE